MTGGAGAVIVAMVVVRMMQMMCRDLANRLAKAYSDALQDDTRDDAVKIPMSAMLVLTQEELHHFQAMMEHLVLFGVSFSF